jgi:hypothetical protein
MNKHQWQRKLYRAGTEALSEILTEPVFLSLCHGSGFEGWHDNYYCIIEQIEAQKLESPPRLFFF